MRLPNCSMARPLLAFLLIGSAWFHSIAAEARKPNVLFLAVDDMNDWVGCLGGYEGDVWTPAIDGLARRGTLFTNAHTAAPVCCPSRAAVMSGLAPSTTGIYNNQQWWKPHQPDLVTLPTLFRRNGYAAVGAGKLFHHTVGNNPPGQWDAYHRLAFRNDAFARQNALYPFTPRMELPEAFPYSGVELYSQEADWGVLPIEESEYDDYVTAGYAIDFLKEPQERPFFLACGIFHPHMPWYTPESYWDLYPLDSIRVPNWDSSDLEDIPEAGRRLAAAKRGDLEILVGPWMALGRKGALAQAHALGGGHARASHRSRA